MIWLMLALAQETDVETPKLAPVPTTRAAPNVGFGPLRLGSQSPFRSGPVADVPSSLAAGRWETRESATWNRMWAQSNDYLLSFETLNRATSVVHGLSDRLQLELGAVASSRFAGDLDGFVKNFHDTFGISQGGRDTVNEGAYHFRVGDVDVPEGGREETSDQVFAGLRYAITDGDERRPALSAGLTLTRSEDGVGASLSLSAAKRWGEVYAYAVVEATRYAQDELYGLAMKRAGASARAALEWRAAEAVGIVVQYLWTLGALDGYGDLSAPSHELGLGLKLEVVPGSILEIGVTENVVVFDNSPDFGLHAGMTVQF